MAKDDTLVTRPMPKRPENGLLAWQATIGYISGQYSLDALLTFQAYPLESGTVGWAAAASWGQNRESVEGAESLPVALRDLWSEVNQHHVIFETREAILKRPANYDDDRWIDADTAAILNRLLHIAGVVYGMDWRLVVIYQPVESQAVRFQARLLALDDSVQIGGQGASLREACQDVYRNAAPYFVAHSGKALDDLDK